MSEQKQAEKKIFKEISKEMGGIVHIVKEK
jgi:hypothetical protein